MVIYKHQFYFCHLDNFMMFYFIINFFCFIGIGFLLGYQFVRYIEYTSNTNKPSYIKYMINFILRFLLIFVLIYIIAIIGVNIENTIINEIIPIVVLIFSILFTVLVMRRNRHLNNQLEK